MFLALNNPLPHDILDPLLFIVQLLIHVREHGEGGFEVDILQNQAVRMEAAG